MPASALAVTGNAVALPVTGLVRLVRQLATGTKSDTLAVGRPAIGSVPFEGDVV
jgi:hypothetical protein